MSARPPPVRPPALTFLASRAAVAYTPSPANMKPQLLNRSALLPSMPVKGKVVQRENSRTESFDGDDFDDECDNISTTSSQDVNDSFEEYVASDDGLSASARLGVLRGARPQNASQKTQNASHKNLLKSMNAPAWWAEALSHHDVEKKAAETTEDSFLHHAWWTRVRPAREDNQTASEGPKAHSPIRSQVLEVGHDEALWSAWWSSVRIRTMTSCAQKRSSYVDSSPGSSSDALRHHDYALARAGGARRSMRKDLSKRTKLESSVAPLPAPVAEPGASQDMPAESALDVAATKESASSATRAAPEPCAEQDTSTTTESAPPSASPSAVLDAMWSQLTTYPMFVTF
ncbi:hypothetical protein T484DRAFT_1973488 [Baffinella frigidus]|nr:hypothetical protein T484DRAFT_1973488 [Cryptophyta sp. CCMP2293]